MQINPHFLYNTLQSINWRAKMLKDGEISSMTEALGKLLRITLSSRNKDSNLGQELDLVGYYMTIQQIRYEDALSFEVNVPEELRQVYLPKFTLQPLAENAIRSFTGTVDSKNSAPKITSDVESLLDDLIEQSVRLVGKPVALMTKDDKIKAIRFLNDTGAFLITRSGDKVASYFNISKFTLYNYIDMGKKMTGGIKNGL